MKTAPTVHLADSSDTVALPELPGEVQLTRRAGIGVRTDAELLGHLWLQLSADQSVDESALRECADSAALILVRRRAARAESARQEDELLAALLDAGDGAEELAARLAAPVDALSVLVGVSLPATGELRRSLAADRFATLVRGFATAYRFAMCTALVDETLYALRVVRPEEPAEQADRAVGQLHAQLALLGVGRIAMAIGDAAPLSTVATTRSNIDRLLRLLLERVAPGDVARVADHRAALDVARLRDLILGSGEHMPDGPVRRLLEYDLPRGGQMVDTLRAWFDCGGDAGLVADRVSLHVNTVRYRMRRIQELTGLDLADSDQRFLAELQLRLHTV